MTKGRKQSKPHTSGFGVSSSSSTYICRRTSFVVSKATTLIIQRFIFIERLHTRTRMLHEQPSQFILPTTICLILQNFMLVSWMLCCRKWNFYWVSPTVIILMLYTSLWKSPLHCPGISLHIFTERGHSNGYDILSGFIVHFDIFSGFHCPF